MCDDEPTRSIGFGITLWPTSVLMRKNRALNSLRGWIFCSGDGDGRWSAGKGAQNGDRGWSVTKAHSTDTPERSENSGARRE